MFAVIRTGGKQYRVAKDDKIVVESLAGEPGSTVEFGDVLMIGEPGKAPDIGMPVLDKAVVFAEVLEQTRGDKIIVFKKRRREGYRRKAGHRQNLTVLRITDISASGTKSVKAAAKPEAKPQAKAEAETKPAPKAKAPAEPAAKPTKKGAAAKSKAPAKGAKKAPKAPTSSKSSKSKE